MLVRWGVLILSFTCILIPSSVRYFDCLLHFSFSAVHPHPNFVHVFYLFTFHCFLLQVYTFSPFLHDLHLSKLQCEPFVCFFITMWQGLFHLISSFSHRVKYYSVAYLITCSNWLTLFLFNLAFFLQFRINLCSILFCCNPLIISNL